MSTRQPCLWIVAAAGVALAGAALAQSTPPKAKPAAPAAIMPEPVPPMVDATFAAWDTDHNGTLSLQEFRTGWMQLRTRTVRELRLQRQFQVMDTNHDGFLDAAEYAHLELIKRAGKSAPPLSAFDANKDGKLNFAEYLDLVNRLAPVRQVPGGKQ